MSSGSIPIDDNGKPILALWNAASGQIVPLTALSQDDGAALNGLLAIANMGYSSGGPPLSNGTPCVTIFFY